MEKDSLFTGLVLGAIIPVVGYVALEQLFNLLGVAGIIPEVASSSISRSMRTIGLLAICTNLIPFEICRRKRYDDTMRGIVFPTLIYVAFWVYKHFYVLFG